MIQESVYTASQGQVAVAADRLRELRARFLLDSSPTPFAWLLKLRTHGQRIRNNSTSEGLITWSPDYAGLRFKDLALDIDGFRGFVWRQVDRLREDLAGLSTSPNCRLANGN